MKPLRRLIGELVAWRWAPVVGLCVASLFYVLVVVALVPEEIGVPTTNARFAQKPTTPTPSEPELPTFPTAMPEPEATPPAAVAAPVRPAGVVDFGRRGFSPPLERPEPPPAPVPPPPPVVAAAPPMAVPPPAPEPTPDPAAPPAPADTGAPALAAAPPPPTPPAGGFVRSIQALRGARFPMPGAPPAAPTPSAPPEPPAAPPAAPPAQ